MPARKTMLMRLGIAFLLSVGVAKAAEESKYPQPLESDLVVKNFKVGSGQILPEIRIHYRTLGQPKRDTQGMVRNAVLILHGTGGQGGNFIRRGLPDDRFAGELFGKGQILDVERYYLIMPDNLG